VAPAKLAERLGQVQMRIGEFRVNLQGNLECLHGPLVIPQFGQDAAALRPGFEVVMVELDRRVVAFERAGQVAGAVQHFGQAEMRFGNPRFLHQAHAERLDRLGRPAFRRQTLSLGKPIGGAPILPLARARFRRKRSAIDHDLAFPRPIEVE